MQAVAPFRSIAQVDARGRCRPGTKKLAELGGIVRDGHMDPNNLLGCSVTSLYDASRIPCIAWKLLPRWLLQADRLRMIDLSQQPDEKNFGPGFIFPCRRHVLGRTGPAAAYACRAHGLPAHSMALECFLIRRTRKAALPPCFVAFSGREPGSGSLENALEAGQRVQLPAISRRCIDAAVARAFPATARTGPSLPGERPLRSPRGRGSLARNPRTGTRLAGKCSYG